MRRTAIVGIVLASVIGGLGGGLWWLRGSLPPMTGAVDLPGLGAPAEAMADAHGIPHIFAASEADAYFALGYVHARDRLWQMEMMRRSAAGRLAEIVGERAKPGDRYMRTLGIYRAAVDSLALLEPGSRSLIEAYAAGVNAFLASHGGPLPPEFVFFRHRPEPWTAADSIAGVKMMAFEIAGNASEELLRLKLRDRLSENQVAALWPPYSGEGPRGVQPYAPVRLADGLIDSLRAVMTEPAPTGIGSNNWAVAGSRSESGKPLLANDPHLGLYVPAFWYLVHLNAANLTVAGATIPGIPAVIVGRNADLAWGVTNTGADVQDLFVERVSPEDSSRYMTADGSEAFAIRQETIRIRGGGEETLTIRSTRHGPVISDASARYAGGVGEGEVLALSWPALGADDTSLQAGLKLAHAGGIDQAIEALRDFHGPQQTFLLADAAGRIAMLAPGRVPVRASGDGWMPTPGWTGAGEWTGWVPFESLPRQLDPWSGALYSANHKIVSDGYGFFLTREWTVPYRAKRIATMLDASRLHSLDSFAPMQQDVISGMARDFMPILLRAPLMGQAASLRALLAAWDGRMDPDRAEPLIFHAWYRALTQRVYADELGPRFAEAWERRSQFMLTALNGDGRWCDDITTSGNETCDQQVVAAFDSALAWLSERFGEDAGGWRWGDAHPAHSRHRIFTSIPVIGWLFDISLPIGGDPYTVMQANTRIADDDQPFAAVHGAALRALFDLSDPDSSRVIISTGQSGNRLSPHYADLAERWAAGDYVPLPMSREGAERISASRLVLLPARTQIGQ